MSGSGRQRWVVGRGQRQLEGHDEAGGKAPAPALCQLTRAAQPHHDACLCAGVPPALRRRPEFWGSTLAVRARVGGLATQLGYAGAHCLAHLSAAVSLLLLLELVSAESVSGRVHVAGCVERREPHLGCALTLNRLRGLKAVQAGRASGVG